MIAATTLCYEYAMLETSPVLDTPPCRDLGVFSKCAAVNVSRRGKAHAVTVVMLLYVGRWLVVFCSQRAHTRKSFSPLKPSSVLLPLLNGNDAPPRSSIRPCSRRTARTTRPTWGRTLSWEFLSRQPRPGRPPRVSPSTRYRAFVLSIVVLARAFALVPNTRSDRIVRAPKKAVASRTRPLRDPQALRLSLLPKRSNTACHLIHVGPGCVRPGSCFSLIA